MTSPGETDTLMIVMGVVLVVAVLGIGILFLRLHTLPERIAHKSHKLQFEIVAVLGLIALFTHMHIFWIAGLLLALIEFPDVGGWLGRIAGSVEKIADNQSKDVTPPAETADDGNPAPGSREVLGGRHDGPRESIVSTRSSEHRELETRA